MDLARRQPGRLDRRRLLIGGAGMAGGALVASGGVASGRRGAAGQASPVPEPRVNTEAAGEIRYQIAASSPDEIGAAQTFLDERFSARYPNIEVAVEPSPGNAYEALIAAMLGGNAPDVFDTWTDRVLGLVDIRGVLDVEPLVGRDLPPEVVADFYPWQWEGTALPGGLRFGLPKYANVFVLWYNKTLFDEAGLGYPDQTWDHTTYAEAARALTKRDGDRVQTYGLHAAPWGRDRFEAKVRAFGGSMVDPNDRTRATFGDEPALAAAEWYRGLQFDDRAIAPLTFFPSSYDSVTAVVAAFGSGRIAMVEEGFYPQAIADGVGDAFPWGFAPVPKGPAAQATLGAIDTFSIWSGTPNQEAAWELVKFLSGAEYQAFLTETSGYLPARASLLPEWQRLTTQSRPALAETGLEIGPEVVQSGSVVTRRLFADDYAAGEIIYPALQKLYVSGETPVSYLTEVQGQVTAELQGTG